MRRTSLLLFGLVVTVLVALGLVVLSSASQANGVRLHGDAYFFMRRQFEYLVAALLVGIAAAWFDYRRWRDHAGLAVVFYGVVFVLLLAVFLFPQVNGSWRWIKCGPLRLQPSEFAKLATVILVSVYLDRIGWRVELFLKGAVWPAIFIGLIAAPVLFEPDFGSVMVIGLAGALVMFVAGVRILHLGALALPAVGVVAYKVATNANRMARLFAFVGSRQTAADGVAKAVDPAAQAAQYQAEQALVAIRNGGMFGVGLGKSMQKQLYLPEAHTDFIFAVGAEELGLLFSISVVLLFMAVFAFSVYIARRSTDRLGKFLALGMGFIIFFQAMFNLGVVCEALPTKGMALPFFSYGGTNLLSAFFAVGTIFSVGIHSSGDRNLLRKVSTDSLKESHDR